MDPLIKMMDPPRTTTLMNETTPFNLSEIWPIPINGCNLGRFGPNLEVPLNDAVGPVRSGGGSGRKRRVNNIGEDDSPKSNSDGRRLKAQGSGDEDENPKVDGEASCVKEGEQKTKPTLEPHKDYIHVRARRGQATDSHSLAERARREKISERMKILQDLVPGCNKVIGKALVLDEIINYIQSLQRQVEFLSMKLEAVNARITPGIEGFPSKDFGQQAFDSAGVGYGSQAPREYGRGSSPEWLHMQVGGGFDRQP